MVFVRRRAVLSVMAGRPGAGVCARTADRVGSDTGCAGVAYCPLLRGGAVYRVLLSYRGGRYRHRMSPGNRLARIETLRSHSAFPIHDCCPDCNVGNSSASRLWMGESSLSDGWRLGDAFRNRDLHLQRDLQILALAESSDHDLGRAD